MEQITTISNELWNNFRDFIKENCELADEREYDIITAWVFATKIPTLWDFYPYLFLNGPHKSGKTQVQTILLELCFYPMTSIGSATSIATLFRELDKGLRTLIIDEADLDGKIDNETFRTFLGILNAGYKKGAIVERQEKDKHGNFKTVSFKVSGFKCIASTSTLPKTLESRCITIRMRKTRTRFPMRINKEKARELNNQFTVWLLKAQANLSNYQITDDIENLLFKTSDNDGRLVQLFAPLYSVAPVEKRQVILDYLKEAGENEIEEQLASWEAEVFTALLKYCFRHPNEHFIPSKEVTEIFNENRTDPVMTRTIARQLKIFGFKYHRMANARGFFYDTKLIEKLKERYPIKIEVEEVTPTSDW